MAPTKIMCVLHIKRFFLPVDTQHHQCPRRSFNPRRDTSYVDTKLRHRDTTIHCHGVSRVDKCNAMPSYWVRQARSSRWPLENTIPGSKYCVNGHSLQQRAYRNTRFSTAAYRTTAVKKQNNNTPPSFPPIHHGAFYTRNTPSGIHYINYLSSPLSHVSITYTGI